MSDPKLHAKLLRFVEAALTNPAHPVYQMGLSHSPMLQHYAINVATLGAITPEQWFAEDPARTAKLAEVMALCEAQDEAEATAQAELTATKAEVQELRDQLAALSAAIATKPVETPAEPAPEA